MERLKKHDLERSFIRQYFWRLRGKRIKQSTGQESEYSREIDLVEVRDQNMQAFECKLSPLQKNNGVKEFRTAYPNCPIHVVTPENWDPSLF